MLNAKPFGGPSSGVTHVVDLDAAVATTTARRGASGGPVGLLVRASDRCYPWYVTKSLEDAFAAAEQLPEQLQDALAAAILEELALERDWESKLRDTVDVVERLADEALEDHRAGRTEDLDPDEL
jgi:hypothetical protein